MANYFRMRRLELKLSRNKLAKRLGVGILALNNWEHFRATPRPGHVTVNMLAEAYEDSIAHIEAALIEQRRPIDEVADQNILAKRQLEAKIGKL
jgi:transcriptional regulator with XRE-family HTH domain